MEDTNLEQSHARFGERVEKSVENPYGWRNITDVNPADTTANSAARIILTKRDFFACIK